VTYGRSGSTLLQGILNAMDGCLVRGENHNACYGLFRTYQSLLKTLKQARQADGARQPTSPWFGASEVDEQRFLEDARQLLLNQLVPRADADRYRCVGFKEIRYLPPDLSEFATAELHEYLDFLVRLLPDSALVFLTRAHDQVAESAWWMAKDAEAVKANLTAFERALSQYGAGREDVFALSYEDMTGRTPRLRALFEFMGAPFDAGTVERVLATPHSYAPKPGRFAKPANCWTRLRDQPMVAFASLDRIAPGVTAGTTLAVRGVVVLQPDAGEGYALQARLCGRDRPVRWGIPSPRIAAAHPGNPHAASARFALEGVRLADGEVLQLAIIDRSGARHVVAELGLGETGKAA
jgi:hypothetical protein